MQATVHRPGARGFAATAIALALLAGCATAPVPVEQIRYFSQAFVAVDTVGQPLLDDLAIAERTQGRQIAARRARGDSQRGAADCPKDRIAWQAIGSGGFVRGFCLPDAGYFSELGDPPATALLRGGLAVIARYADVLQTIAEGRNIPAALDQVQTLGMQVGGLLAVAGVSAAPIGAALAALQPVLGQIAERSNADEVKRLVLEGAPAVGRLIGALRDAAPPMFDTLIEAGATRALLADQAAVQAAELARIEAYRLAVSNYVVLLGRLQAAWDATAAAAAAPPGRGGLADLVAQTSALRADAEAARRTFAVLRAGGMPAAGRAGP